MSTTTSTVKCENTVHRLYWMEGDTWGRGTRYDTHPKRCSWARLSFQRDGNTLLKQSIPIDCEMGIYICSRLRPDRGPAARPGGARQWVCERVDSTNFHGAFFQRAYKTWNKRPKTPEDRRSKTPYSRTTPQGAPPPLASYLLTISQFSRSL